MDDWVWAILMTCSRSQSCPPCKLACGFNELLLWLLQMVNCLHLGMEIMDAWDMGTSRQTRN
ncbi:hypothetical protein OS493_040405 [Desmophyllum pertusum]|uniref:Uncharacterized protein n=1 Tax=Desmophyllum pertusum TaxID=174260 RepID=A0A9X0CHC1_9CNID|nr:hypothetical protein OS493_040405 [Desmophyllum pertusum]